MKRLKLDPDLAWPLFIITLLVVGAVGSLAAVVAAHSDGGAQVIDDYYRKAVNWDEAAARRAAVEALGWTVQVEVGPGPAAARPVEVTVHDRDGRPVTGLEGTLRAWRPHLAAPVAEVALTPTDVPGRYRQPLPIRASGLWDLEVAARQDTLVVEHRVRKDLTR